MIADVNHASDFRRSSSLPTRRRGDPVILVDDGADGTWP